MGGGELGVRGRLLSARAKVGWWQGVCVEVKGATSLPPPFATACTRFPATARPWRRGCPKRGGESRRKGKGTKVQSCPRGRRVRVLGCTMAQGSRVRVATRANANASANGTVRHRGREWHGSAYNGDKEWLGVDG
jgi:hypothetical protein